MILDYKKSVTNYLKNQCMHVSEQWVNDCTDYYLTSNTGISKEQLIQEVRQQWLLINLRDFKIAAFPSNLITEKKIVLPGKYAVQIETMVDCSQSHYSQYQALQKISQDNILATSKPSDDAQNGKRCLLLSITDGVQDLKAIEYKPIPALKLNNTDQLPGLKILIKGPVVCRKGMLMLTNDNVEILGGEVDVLISSNKYVNILARALNISVPDTAEKNESPDLNDDDDLFLNIPDDPGESTVNPPTTSNELSTLVDTIEESPSIGNLQERPSSGDISEIPTNNDAELYEIPLSPAENFQIPEEAMDWDYTHYSEDSNNYSKKNEQAPEHLRPYQPEFIEKSDIPLIEAQDATVANKEVPNVVKRTKIVNGEPFIYLKQLAKINITITSDYFIKAIVLDVIEKIKVSNGNFELKVRICDGSMSTLVVFHTTILETILGFSPLEFSGMAKEKKKNPAINVVMRKGFEKLKEALISLNCIMRLRLFPDKSKLPYVWELIEVNSGHLKLLKARMQ